MKSINRFYPCVRLRQVKSRLIIGIVLVATVLCQQVSNSEAGEDDLLCIGDCMLFRPTPKLKDIFFEFDKYDLDSDSRRILQGNAELLKRNQDLHVEIQGHCDERGGNNYNIALGERRAHSTKKYLVSQGIDSSRINILSYGEEKPFCFKSNEKCWKWNRRGHFVILK
jgi:peptidoglycan-associated lipoprotein